MTDNNHPITPPDELIDQWLKEYYGTRRTGQVNAVERHLATQAARWGADWQLEQVIQFLEANKDFSVETVLRFIRPMMRPQETRND